MSHGHVSRRPRILVIDDEQSARDTLEALLDSEGYSLDFAASGAEALERLVSAPVDLIVCDVMMRGMDGLEVCKRVRAHPEWRFVPLILLTALDGEDDLVQGLEAGADEFLTKPTERIALLARVRAMLRVRGRYEELRSNTTDVDRLLRARRERIVSDARLSGREREVLDLLLLGRTYQDIGQALGVSPRTAKFHQQNLLVKLGADSRVDLARIFL